jgi:hypothetical protein
MLSPLQGLVGTQTGERVLLHLFHYGEIHPSAIAKDFGTAVTPVRRQLDKFERAGLVVSKEIGRSRVFSFNPKSPVAAALQELVRIVYEGIPLRERERVYGSRRRPRQPGKAVLSSS